MSSPGRLAVIALLCAAPARSAGFNPDCSSWQGSTKPLPLDVCNPLPAEALDYAKRCLALFPDKVESKHVIIGNYHGVAGDLVRLYVLEWNASQPHKSMILLRGGLGQGAGNGSVDGRVAGATRDHRDAWDSASSPGGCMRIFGDGGGNQMSSYPEIKAYKVEGLEQRNACVLTRGIHFHESPRVNTNRSEPGDAQSSAAAFNDVLLDENLATGQSPGCFNLSPEDYDFIKKSGFVGKKGTLFLSWDGCRDKVARRGPARRCMNATDVLDCKDRAPAPETLVQKMLEQKPENARQMKEFEGFSDRLNGLKGAFEPK